MKDETIGLIIGLVMFILAAVAAIWIIPEPTGDSSVYEQYTEEMTEAGRQQVIDKLGMVVEPPAIPEWALKKKM